MAFELPPLPYDKNALAPHISANTLDFHHGKHHQAYVTNLNNLIKDKPLAGHSLEDIVTSTFGKADQVGVFNNAAQVWNHTFFWHCMKPGGGGAPSGEVAAAIDASFGSMDKFKEEFKNACVTQFGSGWGWLVADGGKLAVMKTPNAENPDGARQDRAAHLRRLGARLLPRLPEPPARLRPGVHGQPDQLGLRRREPEEGLTRLAIRLTQQDPQTAFCLLSRPP